MAIISNAQHKLFLEALTDSIQQFEQVDASASTSRNFVTELKEKRLLLEMTYAEYDRATRHLRQLIEQYHDIQRRARIRLRTCQHIYSKLKTQ